jgi:beta-glucosidase
MISSLRASLPVVALAAILGARAAAAADTPLYKDPAQPFDQRVADLVSRMSLEQKANQVQVQIPADDALGIPAMRWGVEGLHGFSGSTIFPDATAMAATFDPDLIQRLAGAIADQARYRSNSSLVLWCPTVNLARDPRWGRNMETFGEDPLLAARLGAAYCRGLQGDDPKYLKVAATPKHFAVYSQETGKSSTNARVSERALREYYLVPFEACFTEGGADSTMSAYNAINGIPCSANEKLLTTILRDNWKFHGAVCSDSGAVKMIFTSHHYADTETAAVAAALNAGLDVITDGNQANLPALVMDAEQKGLLKPGVLNRAVSDSLLVRFRLGLFDPPDMVPFSKIRMTLDDTKTQVALALQSAREAITLLQNNPAPRGSGFSRLLPLDLRRVNSIAVIGPYPLYNLYGSYSTGAAIVLAPNGTPATTPGGASPAIVVRGPSPLEALRAAVGDRVIIRTASPTDPQAALDAAASSDLVIFVGGNTNNVDRLGTDRNTLDLPPDQAALLERLAHVNPAIVLVLNGGSAINLENVKPFCPAIVMFWYDGEQGGNALAEVLLGQCNPAGRLPITFYRSLDDLPSIDDYELVVGRTYLYFKKPVSFPFGHGLSYTTFAYDQFSLAPPPHADLAAAITATLNLTNTGARAGDEVVQIYAHQLNPKISRPLKQLVGFTRVNLAQGEKKTLTFSIPLKSLALWDTEEQQWSLEPGTYEFMAGASSEDLRQRATIELK